MGRLAVAELLAAVNAEVAIPARYISLPTELVPGESAPLPLAPPSGDLRGGRTTARGVKAVPNPA